MSNDGKPIHLGPTEAHDEHFKDPRWETTRTPQISKGDCPEWPPAQPQQVPAGLKDGK